MTRAYKQHNHTTASSLNREQRHSKRTTIKNKYLKSEARANRYRDRTWRKERIERINTLCGHLLIRTYNFDFDYFITYKTEEDYDVNTILLQKLLSLTMEKYKYTDIIGVGAEINTEIRMIEHLIAMDDRNYAMRSE